MGWGGEGGGGGGSTVDPSRKLVINYDYVIIFIVGPV